MAEGLLWALGIGAVVLVVLWRCVPVIGKPPKTDTTAPPSPPVDVLTERARQSAELRAELDAIEASLFGEDPAGDIATAADKARDKR